MNDSIKLLGIIQSFVYKPFCPFPFTAYKSENSSKYFKIFLERNASLKSI